MSEQRERSGRDLPCGLPGTLSLEPGCRTTECDGGPLLVRGEVEVTTPDGQVHRSHRPASAICRCGSSARSPWCDGTHKLLGRR